MAVPSQTLLPNGLDALPAPVMVALCQTLKVQTFIHHWYVLSLLVS
jgi:hypothetical protein